MCESVLRECTSVEIHMPWGHISGKWWGPQNSRPLIALHGWQDNAGTFDTLIPLLLPNIGVLAIDLPGHGLSSPFPKGRMYHLIDFVYIICKIMEEYSWETISILGHSMGSAVGFLLAGIFPEKVDFLIGLDAYKPLSFFEKNFIFGMNRIITALLLAEERNSDESEPPSYSYEECIDKLYSGSAVSINRDRCNYILDRNIRKSTKYPDKYYFGRDNRLKYMNVGVWPQTMYAHFLKNIECPILFIRALGSPITDKIGNFNENMSILKQKPKFEYYDVEGTHHVHLNEPEKVCDIINRFLMKLHHMKTIEKSKL